MLTEAILTMTSTYIAIHINANKYINAKKHASKHSKYMLHDVTLHEQPREKSPGLPFPMDASMLLKIANSL